MTVAVTGSMAFDTLLKFSGSFTDYILPDQLERLSVSFLVDSMRRQRGGVAGNICYSMALLGERPMLLASVGEDAADYIAALEAMGVDTSGVLFVPDEFTASFVVSTDRGNRQIANFYIGAMGRSAEISFHHFRDRDIRLAVISPNAPDAMVKYVAECKALGIPYVFDPSQQIPLISREDLRAGIEGAHILIVNDYEFEVIKERTGLSGEAIHRMAETVVITRGEDGSTIYTGGEEIHIPPVPLRRFADPTGAGDAYRAGLLTGRRNDLSWLEAGRLGALTAAYALEEHGTQQHRYTAQEFAARYFECFERTEGVEKFFRRLTDESLSVEG